MTSVFRRLGRFRLGRVLVARVRALVRAIYCFECQYITVQRVGAARTPSEAVDRKIHCATLSSPESIEAIATHLPSAFRDSAEQLKDRVVHGCVVTLAFRRTDGGTLEIVGYELAEPGVFSALGRRHQAPADAVFSHWAEVLPAYRGQRIHALLFTARDAYFQRRGGKLVWGVVVPKNRASLQALGRAGSFVVGMVSRVSLFGGLLVWETSRARIARTLRILGA